MKNDNDTPEEQDDKDGVDWPGDQPPIGPGVYPDPDNDETTFVPLVR